MAVVVDLEAVARSVDTFRSSFLWMSTAVDVLCSLRDSLDYSHNLLSW